jgi:20S proteasome, alpha and beta subunits
MTLFKHILISILFHFVKANSFEPYTLHGGLVSAIAGKDYVIIASDTRLSDGGYNILSREHLQSRLWAVSGFFPSNSCLFHPDGSIVVPKEDEIPSKYRQKEEGLFSVPREKGLHKSEIFRQCPNIIASAGCSSDCEALKRQIRGEVNALQHWCYGRNTLTAAGMANLLGQSLYARRVFPFYSFCVLAGIEETGHARVHVYDAIGSHERVAIGCAGNGKEMLQPILDRMFSSIVEPTDDDVLMTFEEEEEDVTEIVQTKLQRDARAVEASKQRIGLRLEPPVETFVLCDAKKAAGMLVKAYRSVAEREISVGDNVVICIIQRITEKSPSGDVCFSMEVVRSKLKDH